MTIDDACEQFQLNREQRRAFRIIAKHSEETDNAPLRMYVGGAGRTGKSRLIHAISEFFERRGQKRCLRRASYMGIAARNINGMMLHTALQLSSQKRSAKVTDELIAMWQGVDYLLIDEESMIGSVFLADISKSLSIARGCADAFRGINIIFTGDFAQLPPVGQMKLYSHVDTARISSRVGQAAVLGKLLWLSIDTVVILIEIMRQGGESNAEYRQLLERLRFGACTDADYHKLLARSLNNIVPSNANNWHDAPFIVCDNEVKDALNVRATAAFVKRTGQPLMWCDCLDTTSGTPIADNALHAHLQKFNSGTTNQRLGRLPLVVGMPVIIVHNFNLTDGVVNSCTGKLKAVRSSIDVNGHRHTHSCVVETLDAMDDPLPNLQQHEAVALEDTTELTFRHPHSGKKCKIRRTQLPVLPVFALTVHKAQGQTMERAMVDLEGCRGSEGPYVMLSRIKSLEGLAILRPFSKARIVCRPSEDSRREQRRLHLCNLVTMKKHGNAEEKKSAHELLARLVTVPPLTADAPQRDADLRQYLPNLQQLQNVHYEDPALLQTLRTRKWPLPSGSESSKDTSTKQLKLTICERH